MEPSRQTTARSSPFTVAPLAAVFVVAFVIRWLTFTGLGGDDHWALWTAATFLKGDLPFRDFVDVGDPLYWGMSALAQWIVGYRVLGEFLLGGLLIALGFTLAFRLAWQASGSFWVAALLLILALVLMSLSKLYSYPKIFVYPFGLWLCWRYVDRPTLVRAAALAAGVAVAWGYRHDHGAYVGLGAAAAILATHWPQGMRSVLTGATRFGLLLVLTLSPYLLLIQANEGILQYIQARVAIAQQLDASGRTFIWFTIDQAAPRHWFSIDPPRAARVQVEWKPEVTPDIRTDLEQQYSLSNGLHPKKRLYEYFLADVSRDNLLRLLNDPRAVERRGISASYSADGKGGRILNEVVASGAIPADAPPGAKAGVVIQWNTSVADTDIPSLERQYGLIDPTPDRNRWEYALTDVGTNNIRAIVEDAHVSDTGLIERSSFRPMEESSLVRLQRTMPLLRISIAPRFWHGLNAAVFLYYLFFALPVIILIMLVRDRRRGTTRLGMPGGGAKMLAAAVMMAAIDMALLRKLGYISDHAHMAAVLGACVIGQAFTFDRAHIGTSLGAMAAAGILVLVAAFATLTYVSPLHVLAGAGFNDGFQGAWDKATRSLRTQAISPPIDEYAPPGTTGDRGLLRYLYECTRPDDRIWLLTETYPVPYYTERRIVGHIYWSMNFLATPDYERRTIERVDKESVPFILSFGGERPLQFLEAYPLVHAYASKRYTTHHSVTEDKRDRGFSIWLLSDNRRQASGTDGMFGLPCFK